MKYEVRCTNLNHGRMNAPVKFCPTCGDAINRQASGQCDQAVHASLRKSRHVFCHGCGKKLTSVG